MTLLKIIVDGTDAEVAPGQDLLSACLSLGVAVPHFCWHGALGSVGACRLCAVRVHDGPDDAHGRIEMACMMPAADGQRVEVMDPEAAEMRARVIEWLMVNHPHDCAVCEEGGACHLQDMTVATGHHRRRFRFQKRTHRNQDLGPLLTHEMNRCIACYRCTRFYRHYAGGRDLDVFGAHDRVYFGRYEDGPLDSPFAGNLAEICPTGVFNDKGWSEHYVRKWDMAATPSVCGQCSVGCNLFVAERDGRVRRVQNRYHGAINGYFLCDRGRFGALHVAEDRLIQARLDGAPAEEADALAAARQAVSRGAIGIGSPRASLETNFALRRLVGADRFCAAVSDLEAHTIRRMARLLSEGRAASLADLEKADAVLVLGENLTGTAPRAALALRQTARGAADALAAEKGVPAWLDNAARVAGEGRKTPIALVTALPDALDEVATWPLRRTPDEIASFGEAVAASLRGDAVDDAEAKAVAEALAAAEAPLVVAGFGLGRADIVEAAGAVATALGDRVRSTFFPPEANSMGLALMGPAGLDAAVAALEAGAAKVAVVAEADLGERADPHLVDRLRAAAETLIVLDAADTNTTRQADIVLPVADWAEAAGTLVNHEGRAQRCFAAVPPTRRAGWRVIADLMGTAPGWRTLDDVLTALAEDMPQLAAAREAAPSAALRLPLGLVARAPWRMAGRTAHDLAGRVARGTPPTDPDSALTFSMEGAHGGDVPAALRTSHDAAEWHSASATPVLTDGVRGPLKGGDPGISVLADIAAPDPRQQDAPAGDGLIVLPLHDAFAGDELGRRAVRLAMRCPPPVVALHPDDAAALGLGDGTDVAVDGKSAARLIVDPSIPRGHVGASVGRILPRGLSRRVRVEARR